MTLITHWPKANEAATAGDKDAVRALLIQEMESMDEDNFTDATFNKDDIDENVLAAAKKWAAQIEQAVAALEAGNDEAGLEAVEAANSIETDFGDNPNTAHLMSATKWLNE
jgi:hypothetical protein